MPQNPPPPPPQVSNHNRTKLQRHSKNYLKPCLALVSINIFTPEYNNIKITPKTVHTTPRKFLGNVQPKKLFRNPRIFFVQKMPRKFQAQKALPLFMWHYPRSSDIPPALLLRSSHAAIRPAPLHLPHTSSPFFLHTGHDVGLPPVGCTISSSPICRRFCRRGRVGGGAGVSMKHEKTSSTVRKTESKPGEYCSRQTNSIKMCASLKKIPQVLLSMSTQHIEWACRGPRNTIRSSPGFPKEACAFSATLADASLITSSH